MDYLNYFFIILSAIFVLFFPGFSLSLLFFDFDKIDFIERIALSFALSISVVPLVTFYANLLGFKISPGLVILEVLIICISSLLFYLIRYFLKKR